MTFAILKNDKKIHKIHKIYVRIQTPTSFGMMNALTPRYVHGYNVKVKTNLTFIDDQRLAYVTGNNLVLQNIESKTQTFLTLVEKGYEIGAITSCISKGLIAFFAFNETEGKSFIGTIEVNNPKKRKVFDISDEAGRKCVSLNFTTDATYLIALFNEPDWNIYIWKSLKLKPIVKSKLNPITPKGATEMLINPFISHGLELSIIGSRMIRVVNLHDTVLKHHAQVRPEKTPICHCWLSSNLLICGADEGSILIVSEGVLISEIKYNQIDPTFFITPNLYISSIISTTGGFIFGTNEGTCVQLERTVDSGSYKKIKETAALEISSITTMCITVSEDQLLYMNENGQVFYLKLEVESFGSGKADKAAYFVDQMHFGSIMGVVSSFRKTMIATFGSDRTVRIWSYTENRLVFKKQFNEQPNCIDIHPSGLYMLIGFSDSIKLMSILIDDITESWEETILNCRECSFSHGGQYFAVSYENSIYIYSMWSMQVLTIFKGHTAKIKSIAWSADDKKLYSCGIDGRLNIWNIITGKQEHQFQGEDQRYRSIAFTDEKIQRIMTTSKEGNLVIMSYGLQIGNFIDTQITLNIGRLLKDVAWIGSIGMLVASTESDTLIVLSFDAKFHEFKIVSEVSLGNSCISLFTVSADEHQIFVTTEDGYLWSFDINFAAMEGKKEKMHYFSDELLIKRADMGEYDKTVAQLKSKIEQMTFEHENAKVSKDEQHGFRINDMSCKFVVEIDNLKGYVGRLETERNLTSEKRITESRLSRAENTKDFNELEEEYNSKLRIETDKINGLEVYIKHHCVEQQGIIQTSSNQIKDEIASLNTHAETIIKEKKNRIEELKSDTKAHSIKYDISMKEIEEDVDMEIIEISTHYERKIKEEKTATKSISLENKQIKHDVEALGAKLNIEKVELGKSTQEEKTQQIIMLGFQKDIESVHRELRERDEGIIDKEKRISDLKKKNQELEKFKFVLNYKISELRKQVGPREQDIEVLSNQITEVNAELVKIAGINLDLNSVEKNLISKLHSKRNESVTETVRYQEMNTRMSKIRNDLHPLYSSLQNKNDLKKSMNGIYQKYRDVNEEPTSYIISTSEVMNQKAGDPSERTEELVIRTHREHAIANLRTKMNFEHKMKEKHNAQHNIEKTLLNRELNDYRVLLKKEKLRVNPDSNNTPM